MSDNMETIFFTGDLAFWLLLLLAADAHNTKTKKIAARMVALALAGM
jgi:hypothetical protein